jgi:hypothetical protein
MKINNYEPIMVLGNPNTGKTNLCFYLAQESGFEKKYTLGYPAKIKGFKNLSSSQDMRKISNCVVVIDEIDAIISLLDKRSNDDLKDLLKFAYHRGIKLIMNTQLTQFVNKMMEAMIPCWAITELDIFSLKNGSKPKRILLDYLKMPEYINKLTGMSVPIGKFVWFNDKSEAGENGIKSFPDMQIKKDWA